MRKSYLTCHHAAWYTEDWVRICDDCSARFDPATNTWYPEKEKNMEEKEFKIPEDWQIYSTDKYAKKAKTANAKITAAVRMALADMEFHSKQDLDIGPKYAVRCFKKYIDPLFRRYQELGTYDSEPRAAVADVFAKYAKRLGANDNDVYEALRWL